MGEISERILRKNSDLQSLLPLTISAQDGLVDQTIYFNKQVASKQLKNYLLLYNGDFAYNKSYSVGYPYGAIKRLDKYKQGVLSTLYIAFKPTNINSDFLQHYYDTDKWYREIYRNAAEGARNHGLLNISANDFFNSKLITPSDNDEQLKIAKIINVFNRLITLQQRKLEQLKQLKKAMLQQLFVDKNNKQPTLRFKNFKGDWKQHRLGEISTKVTTKNQSNASLPVFTNSAKDGIVNQEKFFDKQIANNTSNYYVVNNNDFVYNPRISKNAPFGPIRRNTLNKTGIMSPLYYIFSLSHNTDENFLSFYFLSSKWYKFMYENGDSGARSDRFAIKDKVFQQMPIKLPLIIEQTEIGKFLNYVNILISLQQTKLTQLTTLKKYLLQKMFI